jgi:hypothetical protein
MACIARISRLSAGRDSEHVQLDQLAKALLEAHCHPRKIVG